MPKKFQLCNNMDRKIIGGDNMKSYATVLISGLSFEEGIKRNNQIAAAWLLYYEDIKHEYLRRIDSNQVYKMDDDVDLGNILNLTKLSSIKPIYSFCCIGRWLELIESVETKLPLNLKVFLMLRRSLRNNRGRRGWTSSLQLKFSEEYARLIRKKPEEVWIEDRNTWTRWWEKVVDYTVRVALKNNLLD